LNRGQLALLTLIVGVLLAGTLAYGILRLYAS
jgi:hypothetical protein